MHEANPLIGETLITLAEAANDFGGVAFDIRAGKDKLFRIILALVDIRLKYLLGFGSDG